MNNYGSDEKSAVQAKFDAQKIAFGPIMFQAARSLRNLGILETLQNNRKKGLSIEEVANNCNIAVYGAKVLLEAAISLEMVYVVDDKFFLTKTGWFVYNDDLTKVNMDFTHDVNYLGFFELEESVKNEKPEGLKVFGKWDTVYEALAKLPESVRKSWFAFDHYYSDIAFPEVLPLVFERNPKKILDVGGNTGKFSIKCCEYNSDVNVTILDLPGQLSDAQKNIDKKGFSDRISGHGMNLLDASKPFPKGYDVVWMSQFLDCFSQEDILHLISRGKDALNKDGALYILETFWDKQKYDAATYSLHATSLYFTCIANGCSQMYHSDDMYKLVDKAGMYVEKTIDNIGVSHTLFICKPK
ncbi:MAG: methyltransferase [Bacteroidota bacterium]